MNKVKKSKKSACFLRFCTVISYMKNKEKIMKNIVPTKEFGYRQPKLRQMKYITGDVLIGFLMDRFDFTAKEAIKMEKRLPGGLKVQVI